MMDWIKESMIVDYDLHIAVAADPAEITVEAEIGLLIYQSLRELLFNIVKHGKCDRASLELAAVDRDWIVLTVSDNGSGFDASRLETKKNRGFGLNYVRERLEMIDGKMEVWSEVGTGTRIQLRVPKQLES
jgi:signal transduction histidine kinase